MLVNFFKKASISSFYKENNFKQCLNKQLLNMFKLWCERGIRLLLKSAFHLALDVRISFLVLGIFPFSLGFLSSLKKKTCCGIVHGCRQVICIASFVHCFKSRFY